MQCVADLTCTGKVRSRNLCSKHYQRLMIRGDFLRDKREYPSLDVLWEMIERLGTRQAVADEIGVRLTAFRSHLQRKGVESEFYQYEANRKCTSPTKICNTCEKEFPRTLEYFYIQKSNKDNLNCKCKSCVKIQSAAVREIRPNPGTKQRYASVMKVSREESKKISEYKEIIKLDPCVYCGVSAEVTDHINPLARGGEHSWENLAPACNACNSAKRATSLLLFLLAR